MCQGKKDSGVGGLSYLHVELWDVDALLGDSETPHGDPMLLLVRGDVPQPYITRYSGVPAVRWDFRPSNTLWDKVAFTGSHPFMSLQVRSGWPLVLCNANAGQRSCILKQ